MLTIQNMSQQKSIPKHQREKQDSDPCPLICSQHLGQIVSKEKTVAQLDANKVHAPISLE